MKAMPDNSGNRFFTHSFRANKELHTTPAVSPMHILMKATKCMIREITIISTYMYNTLDSKVDRTHGVVELSAIQTAADLFLSTRDILHRPELKPARNDDVVFQ